MSDFGERSGVVYCQTPWGQWGQTIDEVLVDISVATGTRSKDVRCEIKPRELVVTVSGKVVVEV